MEPQLRIASYNIRKSVGLDWQRRPDRIMAVLAEVDADIVLLQEVDKRWGKRTGTLASLAGHELLGYRFADVAVRQQSHGWHGNAILYRNQISITDSGRLELPCLEPRGAVTANMEFQGQRFQVVAVHLSLSGRLRDQQYQTLRRHAIDAGCPTVIGGDFNDRGNAATNAFGDAFQVLTPGPSFHSRKPVWPLDRFVLGGDTISAIDSRVHLSELSKVASDHLPIYVDIQLRAI